jgi:hypothetical protein
MLGDDSGTLAVLYKCLGALRFFSTSSLGGAPKPSQPIRSSCVLSLRFRSIAIILLALTSSLRAQPRADLTPLKVVEVKQPDGEILSYRHLAGTTVVQMRGTRLAPQASIRVNVGTRPGFVKLDINRASISGLQPAYRLGKDFLTYVLWSVSMDGRASNLGEITFKGDRPMNMNVTTTYQTFWLMVTAEPYYAVDEPSPMLVLYSAGMAARKQTKKKALSVGSKLFYFTHYTTYDTAGGAAAEATPNELLQARKAIELASGSGILAAKRQGAELEQQYIRLALVQARDFLARAEDAYKKDARNRDVIQFARTAAQTAEDARALSLDEARDQRVRQADKLEQEVTQLRQNTAQPAPEEPQAPPEAQQDPEPAPAPSLPARLASVARQPAMWFALLGWGVAILLLFRRRFI